MADTTRFLPISDPPPQSHRQRRKSSILKFMFGLTLSLTMLVLLLGYENRKSIDQFHQDDDDDDDIKSSSSNRTRGNVSTDLKTGKCSRGVSAGVSEKCSPVSRRGGMPEFVWNGSMLSWQRTAFHFQPEKNWMNDPNGPLFYKGWYHFFYQYNPNAAIWGDIVWGHAVSRDLIHWFHLPLAMEADKWYDENGVWTGSATLLPNGRIIMLYTGATNESIQVQNLAYPSDPDDPLLLAWTKYPGNPVLLPPPGIDVNDFRDPTTAWYTSEGKWRILIGSRINSTGIALVYDTRDFINFEMFTESLHGVNRTGMWECVDFFPVSTSSDSGLDTSVSGPDVRHVMKASLDDSRRDFYAIGTYDEKNVKWYPDDPKIDIGTGIRYDYGVFYAAKTFYDPAKKRRILWGWISESDSQVADLKKGWASLQGIPRTIWLDRKTGSNLLQWPVEEVESLRSRSQTFSNIKLKAGSVVPLALEAGAQLDIEAEFEIDEEAMENAAASNEDKFSCSSHGGANHSGTLGPFGLMVLADDNLTERTPVYFYVFKASNGELKTFFCTDQSGSSTANDVDKHIYGSYVPVLKDERFSMRILVDHSIIESFAQGGRTCITSRVYPTRAIYGAAKIFLFNNAIKASVTSSLKIWQLNAAFSNAVSIRPYSGLWLVVLLVCVLMGM